MNTRASRSSARAIPSLNAGGSASTATATAASSAQGNAANTTGQTSAVNEAHQEQNSSTGGETEVNSPTAPKPIQIPMTVHNLPVITFHDKNEKLFMDDKHIDASHPQHVPITRTDVENLHTQLRQFSSTWPQVNITFQQYFSPRAQSNVEDYILIKKIKINQDIWKCDWLELIKVLRQMYPESNVTTKDFITKSKIALTEYMLNDIDSAKAWHVWKPSHIESLLSQQMNMVNRARKIFDETGVPREQHMEFLKNPTIIGNDCIKAFVNKLRTRNRSWDDDLYQLIQQEIERTKPEPFSLLDLQRIVAEKIMVFDTMKKSLESAAPAQQNVSKTTADYGKSSSQPAQINAIAQQSAGQESKPFTGTIRKDRERQRSRLLQTNYNGSKKINGILESK